MSVELVTAIMFGGLIVTLIMGIPLAWGLGSIAAIVCYVLWGIEGMVTIVYSTFGCMWQIVMVAIPLYICMGVMLERGGLAEALFETAHRWAGSLRGGIAMGTVVICAIFAAMTGVTATATLTMGLIAVPAMLKRGYNKDIALGTVAGAGTLGILIPPSIISILIAVVASISVGKLFVAGILPGILLGGLFIGYIGIRAWLQPKLCPPHPLKFTLKEKFISLRTAILPLLIVLAVLGSIFLGIATPTEAGSLGVVAVLIAVGIHRKLNWKLIKHTTTETFRVTGLTMWIYFGAMCFSAVFTRAGGGQFITDIVLGLGLGPWGIVIVLNLIAFLLGCFLDPFAIIFILVPIAFPIIIDLGFDPVWFGILFVINMQLGYITPPFGYQLFYLKSVAPPGITTADIYRAIFPFLGVMILGMAIIMLFPQIVLWLPNLMMQLRGG
ncbi:C4-dicarboxylate TRAP transporter large permease protein DctM [subsurface metagenome]